MFDVNGVVQVELTRGAPPAHTTTPQPPGWQCLLHAALNAADITAIALASAHGLLATGDGAGGIVVIDLLQVRRLVPLVNKGEGEGRTRGEGGRGRGRGRWGERREQREDEFWCGWIQGFRCCEAWASTPPLQSVRRPLMLLLLTGIRAVGQFAPLALCSVNSESPLVLMLLHRCCVWWSLLQPSVL